MERLADRLGIAVDEARFSGLVKAATFSHMRADADRLAPDASGVLKERSRFFRRGRSGEGSAVLTAEELQRYHQRVASLAPPELSRWLHRDASA